MGVSWITTIILWSYRFLARVDYGNIILVGAPKSDWQTATCSEHCCTDCHWHQEVWSRTVTSIAYWAALTGRPGAGLVQACSDGPPMSPGQGAAVYVELLRANVWSCQSSASAIFHSSSASTDPTISSQHIRRSGFCCGWPDVLELTGRWTANLLWW